jgi:hypothetical protein
VTDHIIIQLYLQGIMSNNNIAGIDIYAPATFHFKDRSKPIEFNPKSIEGRRLNELHNYFSIAIKQHTLFELRGALLLGAKLRVLAGFRERNLAIASNCDVLYALSFSELHQPIPGTGTAQTWTMAQSNKKKKVECIHIGLKKLEEYVVRPSSIS